MNTFNFTDRTSYIAFVRYWKITYKENSEEIRAIKQEIKIAARAEANIDFMQRPGEFSRASNLQSRRENLRSVQRNLIAQRHAAKEEAQRQWLAANEQKVAA